MESKKIVPISADGKPSSLEEGNTITPKKKQVNKAKYWTFTLNNYSDADIKLLIKTFLSKEIKYQFGREVGPKNGIPHLQGFIQSPEKIRPTELKLTDKIHWECCKGNEGQNLTYTGKDLNYFTNIRKLRPLEFLDESKLKKWQLEIVDICNKIPDDRTIYWYWEPKGKMGKTTFAKYLAIRYGAIPIEGKKNDILFCAANFESDIYVFDFERSMEEFISYGAMEKIKNGFYMCSKYESKPIIRNPPHIFCFANFEPNKDMLSSDRWVIHKINEALT